jgi:hypothetical protein
MEGRSDFEQEITAVTEIWMSLRFLCLLLFNCFDVNSNNHCILCALAPLREMNLNFSICETQKTL